MIEVEAHSSLRAFLREQGNKNIWHHHLTMARLVARALRLGRSALIQTGIPLGDTQTQYRLSYLTPALIWKDPVILVTSTNRQQRLLQQEIPPLQQWLQKDKPIQIVNHFPEHNFQGILLTSLADWLTDRLQQQGRFPDNIPTIIDGADSIEDLAIELITLRLQPADWDELMTAHPQQKDLIRDIKIQLTKALFQHPVNPYNSYLIAPKETKILKQLFTLTASQKIPKSPNTGILNWQNFGKQWQTGNQIIWASIIREQGQFSLYCQPIEVATKLNKIWNQQPVVLIGGSLDLQPEATFYRKQLGLGNLTCLKFSTDRQSELIQLYVPDKLPMPNTPQFQEALIQHSRRLINFSIDINKSIVLLIEDTPLKAQVAAVLAAEFGSRIQVEKTNLDSTTILVTGWEFWLRHQHLFPSSYLLVIATLPIPSLENPLVASRVNYYKKQGQDWFRLYLLPTALRKLQQAIAPIRESQGIVALLDNRVNYRSYGKEVLTALSPLAQVNYLDSRKGMGRAN